jgi:hypothetical protein
MHRGLAATHCDWYVGDCALVVLHVQPSLKIDHAWTDVEPVLCRFKQMPGWPVA